MASEEWHYTESDHKEAEELAIRIKASDTWLFETGDDCPEYQLVRLAGLEEELEEAGDDFERVIYDAADRLKVSIEWEDGDDREAIRRKAAALDIADRMQYDADSMRRHFTTWEALCKVSGLWAPTDCEALCKLAGLESEWDDADDETAGDVVRKAAELLGVKIQ